MRAEILAVGSELLTPGREETNGPYLTEKLLSLGIEVGARVTVMDDLELLSAAIATAVARAEIVIATGGLGPTADDLTRAAAACALGRGMQRDEGVIESIRARFTRAGRVMSEINARQADVIAGARVLPNSRGTAPGQWIAIGERRVLILLPGPPKEMRPLFDEIVLPELSAWAGASVLVTRVLRIAGSNESEVDQAAAPIYQRYANPRTTILAAPGQVELHLIGSGATRAAAEAAIEPLVTELRAILGENLFSDDGRELPAVVADLLRTRGETLALAESCTGGLVSARLTDIPGASAFLERGYVTYSNASKTELLGVDAGLIEHEGAVSEAVARAMALGARERACTSLALSVTGIAGPDGGRAEKPVGRVYIALASAQGTFVRRFQFLGDRERVRLQAAQNALEMLRRHLLRAKVD